MFVGKKAISLIKAHVTDDIVIYQFRYILHLKNNVHYIHSYLPMQGVTKVGKLLKRFNILRYIQNFYSMSKFPKLVLFFC